MGWPRMRKGPRITSNLVPPQPGFARGLQTIDWSRSWHRCRARPCDTPSSACTPPRRKESARNWRAMQKAMKAGNLDVAAEAAEKLIEDSKREAIKQLEARQAVATLEDPPRPASPPGPAPSPCRPTSPIRRPASGSCVPPPPDVRRTRRAAGEPTRSSAACRTCRRG